MYAGVSTLIHLPCLSMREATFAYDWVSQGLVLCIQATVNAVLQQCRGHPLAIICAGQALMSRLTRMSRLSGFTGDEDEVWEKWGRELVLDLRTRLLPHAVVGTQIWATALAANCEHRKGDTLLGELQAMLADPPSVEA